MGTEVGTEVAAAAGTEVGALPGTEVGTEVASRRPHPTTATAAATTASHRCTAVSIATRLVRPVGGINLDFHRELVIFVCAHPQLV